MAGAIAGARGTAAAIPAPWYESLEDGANGRSHVEYLADQLVSRRLAATPVGAAANADGPVTMPLWNGNAYRSAMTFGG